jgi:Domain of unknown function (DUF4192)
MFTFSPHSMTELNIQDDPSVMTTMTNPHDLLATVPFLIGYHPQNSIVFVSLQNERAGVAMRIDFPSEPDPQQFSVLINQLARQNADEVVIVLYRPEGNENSDKLIHLIQRMLQEVHIPIAEMISVKAEMWRSILCQDLACCPIDGRPLATSKTLELQVKIGAIDEIDYEGGNFHQAQQQGAFAVNDLIQEFRAKGFQSSPDLIALVLVRLQDLQVRDYALGVASDDLQAEMLRMWAWIASIAPRGYLAPPATLFAELAYEKSEKALALRALERALDDNPSYELAKLLRRTFAAQWSPENFKSMRAELHPKICASLFG